MNIFKIVIPLVVLLVLSASAFTVNEGQKAILFRFGEIVRSDYKPGLHWKIPFVNNVRKFDARIHTIDQKPERFLTLEKKDLVVDSYIKWRIADVARYYKTTQGNKLAAANLIYQNVNNGLRNEFGKRTVQEVISGDRTDIMSILTAEASDAASELGIQIVDVRIKKIDWPANVEDSVYRRMRAERERVARDFRSKGAETAERIRADADRQSAVILAEAYRDAQIVRGEGDAKATEIYAKAYSKDPEFYKFTRSLSAYEKNFSSKSDVILLQPNSQYFQYFKSSHGK